MTDAGQEFSDADAGFMRDALLLAERGLFSTDPNPRVGCVVVRDGAVVGRGWHERAGGPHAEVVALDEAGAAARGADVYVSLEPCAHQGRTGPCTQALIAAGVGRVVAALQDPNPEVAGRGMAQLAAAGIDTGCGLLADEARELNAGFLRRMAGGRPWVMLKSAASLDGRTALADGESQWITGAQAREDVHRYRARSSCIVTGIGTVLADDPRMTVRLAGVEVKEPALVVLDSALRCPETARVLAHPGGCLLLTGEAHAASRRAERLRAAGAEVQAVAGDTAGLSLEAVLEVVRSRAANEVMVEAGPTLGGAFLAAGLIDEWVIYLAPHLLGPQARPLAVLDPLQNMDDRLAYAWQDVRRVGADLRLVLRPRRSHTES